MGTQTRQNPASVPSLELLKLAAELGCAESRATASRALANSMGAEALLIFVRDEEADMLLPAPGFQHVGRDDRRWQSFLSDCVREGHAVARLPFERDHSELCAEGFAWERDAVLVLLGNTRTTADVRWFRTLLPLLYSVFHGEQVAAHATSDASSATAAAARANKTKSDFLATMSHELRTPLNAIGGHVQLLHMGLRGPVTAEQRQALDRIDRAQRHLLGLINDILNLSRIEAGHVEYTLVSVPLDDVLADITPMIEPQLLAKQLEYEVRDPGALPVACADRDKLQQILLNLLSNAVKFTEPGGRIWIEARELDALPHDVVIRVSDTGCGLPADKLEAIFEPFVQVRADLSRPHEGTGLGLAISRDLARGMHGNLIAQSGEFGGSTFVLTLPRG